MNDLDRTIRLASLRAGRQEPEKRPFPGGFILSLSCGRQRQFAYSARGSRLEPHGEDRFAYYNSFVVV